MLRITEIDKDQHHKMLLLEGKVANEWVLEFKLLSQSIMTQKLRLTIDLRGVDFVDAAGITALKEIANGNARLINCSEFLRQLLQENCPCETE